MPELPSDPDQLPVHPGHSRSVFVGRQREMDELKAALDDAMSGHGRLVMLVGEPGIGKTRTVQELASHAQERGTQVLWGWCYGEGGAPPYWPWLQPIRSYARQTNPEQLWPQMGPGAADIAVIVPEIRSKLPDLETPSELEPEQARFRLFDSITTFLKNAAQSQPLMLVLDDLHWADQSSLLLLQFLARQLGESYLLVVGCYRDVELSRQHLLSEALAQLSREQVFQRVLLRGLRQEYTGQFIEAITGVQPRQGLVDTIYTRTEGNPFFMTEVIRLLSSRGELAAIGASRPEGTQVPEGVKEAIGRRLNRLSGECNQTLTTASIIGREFDFRLLSRLIDDLTESQQLGAIDEARDSHLIEEVPGAVERYQFRHALFQQSLAEELSTSRRVRLHARIAEALDELYGSDVEDHAAELAHHYAEAEAVLGSEKLVRYAMMAGERALATYAYEEAQDQFQRALMAKQASHFSVGSDPGSSSSSTQVVDVDTATILFGLGRAQTAMSGTGQSQKAIDTFRRAFDAFVEVGDTVNAVAVAMFPYGGLAFTSSTADIAVRALDMVTTDSIEAGYLLCHYGFARFWQNSEYDGARENLDRAIEIAQRDGDSPLEVHALGYSATLEMFQGHYEEAIKECLRVFELAQPIGELLSLVRARRECSMILTNMGDCTGAQIHATAGLEVAESLHQSQWIVTTLYCNTKLAVLKGEWKAAQELIDRSIAESPRDIYSRSANALLHFYLGDAEESNKYIRPVLEVLPDVLVGAGYQHAWAAALVPLFARVTGMTDLFDSAELAANAVLSSPSSPNHNICLARTGLALIAVQQGDTESATEQYSFLVSQRGLILSWSTLCADRVLGLLAQTMGNPDASQTHFEDALDFCRKAGYRPELAWSCCDYSDTLRERDAEGDRARAIALLDESLAISSELGMRPLKERVQARLAGLKARAPRTPEYPSGLSQREVEVLRLIAAGKTDREIAEELYISFRTVGNHVRNILNKTNTSNRTEAATFAAHQGLT